METLTVTAHKDGTLQKGLHPGGGWAFVFHNHRPPPGPAGTWYELTIEMNEGPDKTIVTGMGIMRKDKNMIVGQGELVTSRVTVEKPVSVFNKISSFFIERDIKTMQKKFQRKSGIVFAKRRQSGAFFPIMYLSKPKWVTEDEFQELLNAIDIQFIKK